MARKKTVLAKRPWRLLGIALLWARKGGAFRRRMILDLRMVINKSIPSSGSSSAQTHNRIHYFEREFSLDDSPAFSCSKKHRTASMRLPRMPCITAPSVDFDNENDWIDDFKGENRRECIGSNEEVEEEDCDVAEEVEDEERGIDSMAEEFIAKFYEQMKLQRQVSLLEYDEMLRRGMSS